MNEAMEKLKMKKTKLWVFPEGYRNHSSQIVEFKKGAFHMAIQAQVPILPIVFSSYKTFMRKSERYFGRGEIIIEILPEISTKGLTSKDINELMERTRDLMIKKYEELNREIESKNKKIEWNARDKKKRTRHDKESFKKLLVELFSCNFFVLNINFF